MTLWTAAPGPNTLPPVTDDHRRGRGKPRRQPDAVSSVRIQATCTEEERDQWAAYAEQEGVPLGEAIRLLLDRWTKGKIGLGK